MIDVGISFCVYFLRFPLIGELILLFFLQSLKQNKMEIKVDRKVFSDECISKVIYWFSVEYTISRRLESDTIESITFDSSLDNKEQEELKRLFLQKLNDFKLRQIVETETHDIRTILYAKAFEKYVD